jgi:hypothetical protein
MPARQSEEGRHSPGREPLWGESWYFDFAAPDASIGGYARLGLYPNLGVAWYWAYLVRPGQPLIAVRDHEVGLPRGRELEVRSEGLWSALTCEDPNDHWSIGLEAFAVAMEDPAEAYRGEWGDRVGLGFDLEWEASAPVFPYVGVTRYEQPCVVHGEVLVGDERLSIEGPGQRDHSWGVRDWWAFPWCWTAGRLADGTAFHGVAAPGFATGYVGAQSVSSVSVDTTLGDDDLPTSASLAVGDLTLAVAPIAHAPVMLEAPDGRKSRFPRALSQYTADDGRSGVGWTEWLQPPRR